MATKGANFGAYIAAALAGEAGGHITHIGVGDSSTAESTSHNDLQAATNKLRKAATVVRSTATNTITASFGNGEAEWAWKEMAIFNAASSGNMLIRDINGAVSWGTKGAGEIWDVTITSAAS